MAGGNRSKGKSPQNLGKRLNILERELAQTNQAVRGLKDTLNVKDNWPAEVSQWIGKDVDITATTKKYRGTLKWIDRYTLAIIEEGEEDATILQKGNIESMKLARRAADGSTS